MVMRAMITGAIKITTMTRSQNTSTALLAKPKSASRLLATLERPTKYG